jgi:hypothetical protein
MSNNKEGKFLYMWKREKENTNEENERKSPRASLSEWHIAIEKKENDQGSGITDTTT